MNDILISFVIPFHNRYEMLREAVDSVTASGFKQTEVILIDDASQEDGLESALNYFRSYNNIKYKRLEIRQGPGNARNRALTLAEGEWIFFLDSDDVIYPDMLPKLASALQNERDADLMFFENSGFKYPDGYIEKKHVHFSPLEALPLDSIFRVHFFGQLWHYCFRRSFLDKYRIHCPDISFHEDFCFSLQSLCYARKTAVFPYTFHEYRVNSAGSINSAPDDPLSANQRIIEGHHKFYTVIKEMLGSAINDSKKESLRTLLSHCILYSPPPPPSNILDSGCGLLECEEKAFRKFFDSVKTHSDGFRKKIFITPCFSSCVNVYNLIASWGGNTAGFLDNNPDFWTSKLVISNGFSVSKTADFRQSGDALILLFGFHADIIARQLDAMGLAQNRDYIVTGLLG